MSGWRSPAGTSPAWPNSKFGVCKCLHDLCTRHAAWPSLQPLDPGSNATERDLDNLTNCWISRLELHPFPQQCAEKSLASAQGAQNIRNGGNLAAGTPHKSL